MPGAPALTATASQPALAALKLVPSSTPSFPAESLRVSKPVWWLESRFHFSFAEYYDPARENFGALRVLNDDLVKPRSGFGSHPHRNAEIFSYVVNGKLSHKDSMGSKEALGRGSVQYMSAGSGVVHSEMNDENETCRFLQVWLTPSVRGGQPQYGSRTYAKADRTNRLLQLLGGNGPLPSWVDNPSPDLIRLRQDANVFVSEAAPGSTFDLELAPQRQAYLVCIEGTLRLNGEQLAMRDGSQIIGFDDVSSRVNIEALDKGVHFMLIEMAKAD